MIAAGAGVSAVGYAAFLRYPITPAGVGGPKFREEYDVGDWARAVVEEGPDHAKTFTAQVALIYLVLYRKFALSWMGPLVVGAVVKNDVCPWSY